jgi:GNAT superfamily N-acetyltransferase
MFLLQKHLRRGELNEDVWSEYLDWKYLRNPFMEAPLIHLAMDAGEVVGMRGMYGSRWSVGKPGRQVDIPCAGDLVVAPAHRRRGIFRLLARAALEECARRGYTHTLSFSPSSVASAGLAGMGWRALGTFEPMRRRSLSLRIANAVRDRGLQLRALARNARRIAEPPSLSTVPAAPVGLPPPWRRRRPRRSFERLDALSRSSGDLLRLSRSPEPETMAELVERIGNDGRMRQVRNAEYFRWRFGNPTSRYRFLFRNDAGRLDGYLVLQTSILSTKLAVNIVEWEATLPTVRAELLRAAVERGRFRDLRIWSTSLPETSRALLRDLGFRRVGEAPGVAERRLMIRPVRDEMLERDWVLAGRRISDIADWNLQMSDSDAF